jgi:hypothetical protein
MNWKSRIIFEALEIITPSQIEIDFVEDIINGGKIDNKERSMSICAFLEKEGMEQLVYDKLCAISEKFKVVQIGDTVIIDKKLRPSVISELSEEQKFYVSLISRLNSELISEQIITPMQKSQIEEYLIKNLSKK